MIEETGIIYQIIYNLSAYVWGNEILTCLSIVFFFTILAMLVQIPIPFAFAVNIPLIVIFTAYSLIPFFVGGLWASIYLVIAVASFLTGVGANS
jgi:hypothetical protein